MREREAKEKERRKKARDAGGDVSSSESSSSDEEALRGGGIAEFKEKGGTKGDGKGLKQLKARVRYYTSPQAVMDRTLRRAINTNTSVLPLSLARCFLELTFLTTVQLGGYSSATCR